jgi:hypothetical protein
LASETTKVIAKREIMGVLINHELTPHEAETVLQQSLQSYNQMIRTEGVKS